MLLTSSPSLPFLAWTLRALVWTASIRALIPALPLSALWLPDCFSRLNYFLFSSKVHLCFARILLSHLLYSHERYGPSAQTRLSPTSISLEGSTFSQLPHLTLYSFARFSRRCSLSTYRRSFDPQQTTYSSLESHREQLTNCSTRQKTTQPPPFARSRPAEGLVTVLRIDNRSGGKGSNNRK